MTDTTADETSSPSATSIAIENATQARSHAYSPYSDFKMGACVVGTQGEVIHGTLIENVSLGLAMCAERVALFSAITAGVVPGVLAVASPRTEDQLTFPCGACLQVALELAGPELRVVAVDTDGVHEETSLRALLPRAPHRFTPSTV